MDVVSGSPDEVLEVLLGGRGRCVPEDAVPLVRSEVCQPDRVLLPQRQLLLLTRSPFGRAQQGVLALVCKERRYIGYVLPNRICSVNIFMFHEEK